MQKIFRGKSTNPLYITSEGIELEIAADLILNMHGIYRIPTLLKKVDQLCRNWKLFLISSHISLINYVFFYQLVINSIFVS